MCLLIKFVLETNGKLINCEFEPIQNKLLYYNLFVLDVSLFNLSQTEGFILNWYI
jgi:hypothetical protein